MANIGEPERRRQIEAPPLTVPEPEPAVAPAETPESEPVPA